MDLLDEGIDGIVQRTRDFLADDGVDVYVYQLLPDRWFRLTREDGAVFLTDTGAWRYRSANIDVVAFHDPRCREALTYHGVLSQAILDALWAGIKTGMEPVPLTAVPF